MPFALSRIRPPRPRDVLARPALERSLREALATTRVVLLCAAAGYGKTATLARALEGLPAGEALAWISFDEDDDLSRLLECLMAALEPFDPPWRTAPEGLVGAALSGATPEALPAMVVELVNTLDACDAPHGLIVLDDLHHLRDEAGLRFVDLLLLHLSPRWSVAITARHEPPLRLARLRAAGELRDFREEQLRFSAEESQALLGGAGFDAAAAGLLHRRYAGWPAGLRLALSGAGHAAPGAATGGTIDRQAFDFLASEVLDRIDPGLRRFLLMTSVLHELEPARAAALSARAFGGDERSAFWLAEIERLSLFATLLDEPPGTLRLHDLFRDALRHRARLEPDWPRWLQRAAELEADPVRRQSLLMQAGRHDLAARALLDDFVDIIAVQGSVPKLLQMCAAFPPDFAEGDADLHRVRGMAHWAIWETRQAEHHLARAAALYAVRGDEPRRQLALAQRAITLIGLGRLDEAAAALDAVGAEPVGPETIEQRTVMRLGRTWLALERCEFHAVGPAFEALVRALEAQLALRLWFSTVPPPRQTPCRGVAPALARWAEGALAIAGDRPVPLRALALLTQGWIAVWQGRLADATELLQRAEADAEWVGQQVIARHHALALRAVLAAFAGRREEAVPMLRQRLAEHPKGYGDWGLWHSLFFTGRVAAACGDVALVQEAVDRLASLQPTLSDCTPRRLQPLVGLRGTLASLRGEDPALSWEQALVQEEALDLYGQAAEVRVRLAALWLARGAREKAAQTLAPLLEAAVDPGGALFAREALRQLADIDWHAELGPEAAATLRRWAHAASPARGADAAGVSGATERPEGLDVPAGHGLTARELDVLAQIAHGASNKLIARALDLSPHTVKRHVANILGKLDLASREQASAWWQAQRARPAPARQR